MLLFLLRQIYTLEIEIEANRLGQALYTRIGEIDLKSSKMSDCI